MSTIALLQPHGLIPIVVVATGFVSAWAAIKVSAARKKYDIKYPQMYAEQSDKNATAFNCVQRAHQNVLEQLPVFYALLFTASIYRPLPAAVFGVVRIVGFIVYVSGYSTGKPNKRIRGNFGYLGLIGLLGLSIETSIKMLGYL